MIEFIIVVTLAMAFLGAIWNTSSLVNVFFKILFWALVIWGSILIINHFTGDRLPELSMPKSEAPRVLGLTTR